MNKVRYVVMGATAALVLFVALIATLGGNGASAAPSLIPTPVSVNPRGNYPAKDVVFYASKVMTTAETANAQGVEEHEVIDLQWIIDQTDVNTATVKLQFSNDGVNWVDGATVVSSNAADANDMQQFALFGKYARAHTTLGNTNPVTITLIGLAK